ncbi:hypothetical protein MASR1M31_17650 [Porphyromonadaceae bacterium]
MKGDFEMPSIETTAHILHYTLRDFDALHPRKLQNQALNEATENMYSLVLNGIKTAN